MSTATVSRVINGSDKVSAQTFAKVDAIIKEHGYQPSQAAIGLSQRHSRYVPIFLDSFMSDFVVGYMDVACEIIQTAGFFPVILKTSNSIILELNMKKFAQIRPQFCIIIGNTKINGINLPKNRVIRVKEEGAGAPAALDVRRMVKEIIS